MIELERHIEILLLSHDCIIVPGLGGFMAHHIPARYDEEEELFLPPLRTLGFNPQLQLNDHLLAQSYIEAYDISYPDALQRIEEEVEELRQHLETKGQYELNDIGVLSLNKEGNLEFEPCEAGILTPALYGLNSFEMPRIEKQPKQQEPAEPAPPIQDDAITIRMSWLRNAVAVAAAVLAFFLISKPVANSDLAVQQSSILPISMKDEPKQPAPIVESVSAAAQAEQPATPLQAQKAQAQPQQADRQVAPSFVIVLASQTTASNANAFIGRLHREGFSSARSLAMSGSKLVRVVYGSYASDSEAHNSLRHLRQTSSTFDEAWVLNVSQ